MIIKSNSGSTFKFVGVRGDEPIKSLEGFNMIYFDPNEAEDDSEEFDYDEEDEDYDDEEYEE